jgi:uncharacterized protein YecE (DUF72 family)
MTFWQSSPQTAPAHAGMPDLLRKKGCSLCIEDTDENPVDGIISTASWGYLRLRRSDYSDDDLSRWAELIFSQPWERAFVFFKHEEEARGADMAIRFREIFGSRFSGTKLKTGGIAK